MDVRMAVRDGGCALLAAVVPGTTWQGGGALIDVSERREGRYTIGYMGIVGCFSSCLATPHTGLKRTSPLHSRMHAYELHVGPHKAVCIPLTLHLTCKCMPTTRLVHSPLSTQVHAHGPIAALRVEGSVAVSHASLATSALKHPVSNLSADIQVRGGVDRQRYNMFNAVLLYCLLMLSLGALGMKAGHHTVPYILCDTNQRLCAPMNMAFILGNE